MPDNPGQYAADKFYLESTTDKEKILEIAKTEDIDGILAYASDPAAPTAAYVAEKLGLPTNPYISVNTLCNKDELRSFLKDNGFSVPLSKGFSDIGEAVDGCSDFRYPIIIKPVDSSGSGPGNVATTGVFTIPAMKRSGFPPHLAANVEAHSSTMGNMIPPAGMIATAFAILDKMYPNKYTISQYWLLLWGVAVWFIIQRIITMYAM